MAQIEPIIEPDRVLDDLGGKSVAIVSSSWLFHPRMVARRYLTWQYLPCEIVISYHAVERPEGILAHIN
jgi:hypothetical protein